MCVLTCPLPVVFLDQGADLLKLADRPPPPDSRPPLVTLDELLGLSQSEAPPLEKKNKRGRGKDKQKRKTRVTKSHVKSQPADSQGVLPPPPAPPLPPPPECMSRRLSALASRRAAPGTNASASPHLPLMP
jgi:hypothetical protein